VPSGIYMRRKVTVKNGKNIQIPTTFMYCWENKKKTREKERRQE
jgi:hypothetical protein